MARTPAVNTMPVGVFSGGVDLGTGNYETKLAILDKQLEAAQAHLKTQQDIITKLTGKTDKTSAQKLAAAKRQLSIYQSRVKSLSAQKVNLQTEHFTSTGQYEQLLQGENRDAFLALSTLFEQYGLGSLAGKIYEYVKNGYGADTISILLQDTAEYKQRFAANEARRKAGLSVLSPAEYLSVENSYRQIMRQSGLPEGFYDTNDDFTSFISADMSPTELQSRVELATQATALAHPADKEALRQMGLSDGELTAYFLDQKRALPFIQKTVATAAIGAEAIQRGLAFDQRYAEELAVSGITREQASQGYAQIADEFTDLQQLASIYGGGWSQRQAEEATFVGGTAASEQRQRLQQRERGAFSGATGGARSGLAQRGGAR